MNSSCECRESALWFLHGQHKEYTFLEGTIQKYRPEFQNLEFLLKVKINYYIIGKYRKADYPALFCLSDV